MHQFEDLRKDWKWRVSQQQRAEQSQRFSQLMSFCTGHGGFKSTYRRSMLIVAKMNVLLRVSVLGHRGFDSIGIKIWQDGMKSLILCYCCDHYRKRGFC